LVDGLLGKTAATNGIVKVEIATGARTEAEFQDNRETLDALINLSMGERTWALASRVGFELRRQGVTVSLPDLIIAASAIEHDAVLIHADADFDRIAAHSDLKVESFAAVL